MEIYSDIFKSLRRKIKVSEINKVSETFQLLKVAKVPKTTRKLSEGGKGCIIKCFFPFLWFVTSDHK